MRGLFWLGIVLIIHSLWVWIEFRRDYEFQNKEETQIPRDIKIRFFIGIGLIFTKLINILKELKMAKI